MNQPQQTGSRTGRFRPTHTASTISRYFVPRYCGNLAKFLITPAAHANIKARSMAMTFALSLTPRGTIRRFISLTKTRGRSGSKAILNSTRVLWI
jgi:hypothetical protein